MINIDGKIYRNLQEQVLKNQSDINAIIKSSEIITDYGIKIVGYAAIPEDLPDPAVYSGHFGDCYLVGPEGNYEVYIFTAPFDGEEYPQWFNLGGFPAPGPEGKPGPQGEKGETGRGNTWQSAGYNPPVGTSNMKGDQALNTSNGNVYEFDGKAWRLTGSIEGPQGIQGVTGPQGMQGIEGPRGPRGEQGAPGQAFRIAGILASAAVLPDPKTTPDYIAYLVGTPGNYNLYVQIQDVWTNTGKVSGVQGPKGDKGDTGAQGPIGPEGKQGEVGPVGPMGPQGKTGDTGKTGPIGPQGPKGDKGETGATGPQGLKGDRGPAGETGPEGKVGPQGPIGPTGPKGADSTVPGPKGDKGDRGLTGPAGPQGKEGPQGKTGPAGPQPPLTNSYTGTSTTVALSQKGANDMKTALSAEDKRLDGLIDSLDSTKADNTVINSLKTDINNLKSNKADKIALEYKAEINVGRPLLNDQRLVKSNSTRDFSYTPTDNGYLYIEYAATKTLSNRIEWHYLGQSVTDIRVITTSNTSVYVNHFLYPVCKDVTYQFWVHYPSDGRYKTVYFIPREE